MNSRRLFRQAFAEIDLSALQFNVAQIRHKIGKQCDIMAVIKANAYGHGDVDIAKCLENCDVSFLAVAYIEEGARLRDAGIKSSIVVLTGGQDPKTFPELHRYRLTPVFYDLDFLIAYNDFCRKKRKQGAVHLKFDTGMNRLGFSKSMTAQVFKKLPQLRNLKFEGMMTHLANAERSSHFNHVQIQNFRRIKMECPIKFKYYHVANSGSILNEFGANENLVRPGLILYGGYPNNSLRKKCFLKPVMSLKSQIIQLKSVRRGDYISYGYTHRFQNDSIVATIPIGYADGFSRFFSNKGEVLIRGKRAPIVGVICMDVFMVDVGHILGVSLRDEVVLLGSQKKEKITVEELAERIQTIPWEIFCAITDRVPRVHINPLR